MIVSILSTVVSQGLLKLFQIRLQTAAFIYKARNSRSFSVGLFLGYSRKFQSSHLFPEHLLLAGPLRRSCLQGKKFCLGEEEEIRTICNFVNVFVFFLFFFHISTQAGTWNISCVTVEARIWNKPIQPFVSQLR